MKRQFVPIILLFTFAFCTPKPQTEASQILPSDEIPMEYSKENFYMPILEAIVNDSLAFKLFFDTGVPGKYIIVSDSLKNKLTEDNVSIQIGKTKKQMGIDFIESNRTSFFSVYGKDLILAGWEFFEDKAIELSFESLCIRVYDSLPDVTEYSRTKITVTPSSHLAIPIQVVLQGKTMEDTVFIDTGNNSYVSFSTELIEKYEINIEDAYHGKSVTNVGLYSGYSLPADTIKIGDLYVADTDLRVAFRPRTKNRSIGDC